jgi:putative tryptophan/tyrosine transport system substrate-binding protein
MNRRAFVTGLGAVLAVPLSVEAQQAGKIYRLGVLVLGSEQQFKDHRIMKAFRAGLLELGFTEGENLKIEYRWAEGQIERLDVLAAELVRLDVDTIFVAGPIQSVRAAKRATDTIPIVFAGVGRPVEAGLVETLARPGGNATGTTYFQQLLEPKQLQLLKAAIPTLSSVGVIRSPHGKTETDYRTALHRELQGAAQALNLHLQFVELNASNELDEAMAAVARRRVGALLFPASAFWYIHARRIADLAVKHGLPALSAHPEFAEAGGLLAYGADVADIYRRCGHYVAKIFKGAKPADLPVEEPTKFELVVNLKTAKALGLTIPPSLLLRADQVIE